MQTILLNLLNCVVLINVILANLKLYNEIYFVKDTEELYVLR